MVRNCEMVETEGGAPGELPQISVAKPPRRKRIRQKKDKTVSRFQAGGKGKNHPCYSNRVII